MPLNQAFDIPSLHAAYEEGLSPVVVVVGEVVVVVVVAGGVGGMGVVVAFRVQVWLPQVRVRKSVDNVACAFQSDAKTTFADVKYP